MTLTNNNYYKMRWIYALKNSKFTYRVYKLNINDSVIIYKKYWQKNNLLIVLHGTLYAMKIFKNKKKISTIILNRNKVFKAHLDNSESYYKLIALEKSYITNINIDNIQIKNPISKKLLGNVMNSYKETIKIYETLNRIIQERQTSKRIIQNIFFILLHFGLIKNKQIYLPFKLSQKNLSSISQTSQGKTSQVIKEINRRWQMKHQTKISIEIKNLLNLTVE